MRRFVPLLRTKAPDRAMDRLCSGRVLGLRSGDSCFPKATVSAGLLALALATATASRSATGLATPMAPRSGPWWATRLGAALATEKASRSARRLAEVLAMATAQGWESLPALAWGLWWARCG